MFTDPFYTLSTFEKASTIALYLTIALAIIAAAIGFLIYKKKPEAATSFKYTATGLSVGYAIGLIGILLYLKLNEYFAAGYVDLSTFIPIVVILAAVIVFAIIGLLTSIFRNDKLPVYAKCAALFFGVMLITMFILATVKQYKTNGAYDAGSEVGLYICTAAVVAIIVALAWLFGKKHENSTKSIVFGAMCIAMSFALSYVRFLSLPLGGSITLASLLPLMIYSYMFGIKKGVLLGAVYGLFQFIQEPWFYHPIQFLLDYPIAFMAIGLTGIFHELKIFEKIKPLQFAFGAVLAVLLRYSSHVISGIFVFGSGDPENYGAVAWSFLYNSFTLADLAIDLVAGCTLMASKQFCRMLDAQSASNIKVKVEKENIEQSNIAENK